MTPEQERQYEQLKRAGFEYDYTSHDGCVFVKKYEYTRETRFTIDTVVIQCDGDYYSLPVISAILE